MATANMYALSLRHDGRVPEKAHEDGVAFFVPQLAKVKTNIMCQTNNKHLLFSYEKAGGIGEFSGPTSPTLPYRKQGDKSYYTEENLKKRQKLTEDRKVLAGIGRFWDTFPNIRQGQTAIDQKDYVDVFMKFYKALVAPHEFSIGEARKIVERDWGRDVGDSDAMSKALFFRSLFEVLSMSTALTLICGTWQADIWTISISADEYVSFLNKLFDRVTMKIQDQKTSLWVTVFAELDKIRSFAEPKESMAPVVIALSAVTTNQDQESSAPKASGRNSSQAPVSSTGSGSATGPSSSTVAKPRPPLLKKKTLSSSDNMLLAEDVPVISTGGGSFRRLPEIAMPATTSVAGEPAVGDPQARSSSAKEESQQGQQLNFRVGDANNSPASGASSSRRDDKSPKALSGTGDNNNNNSDEAGASTTTTATSTSNVGPITYRQSRFTRTGSLKGDLVSPTRRSAFGDSAKESGGSASRPTASDLPPQPIRLAMPSIYLSPDLTESQATYRAARRRIRESSKLAQRLRRITF